MKSNWLILTLVQMASLFVKQIFPETPDNFVPFKGAIRVAMQIVCLAQRTGAKGRAQQTTTEIKCDDRGAMM